MRIKSRNLIYRSVLAALLACLIFVALFALENSTDENSIEVSAEVWNGEVAAAFSGGDGNSEKTAYQISNAAELAYLATLINNNVSSSYNTAFYKLTADIILNNLDEYPIWGTSFAPVNNWIPIGNAINPFGGNFDGNGYVIKGMYVNCITEDYKGLFGKAIGVIKNVGIDESYVAGKAYIGGVVGHCTQLVSNCYNKGTVYAASTNCGGIAGYIGDGGDIEDCFNLGDVSGAGQYVGGVLGQLKSATSYINNCYNSGSVDGTNKGVGGVVGYNEYGVILNVSNSGSVSGTSQYIGGVVGRSNGKVSNTLNSGAVSANGASSSNCSAIGGIVGYNEGLGFLYNSYNIGSVVKHSDNNTALIGGVVGHNTNSINYSYSLRNTTSDLPLIGSSTGTTVLVNQVRCFISSGQFKYNGENPNNVTINEEIYYTLQTALSAWINTQSSNTPAYYKWITYSTKMPTLSPWSGAVAVNYNGGNGSAENPYKIANAEQFAYFRNQINTDSSGQTAGLYFELTNNINLNNTMYVNDWINYSLSLSEYVLNEWTPIGTSANEFRGIFNGNGYIISGVYVNNAQGSESGLFGKSSGIIQNVNLVNSFILGGQASGSIVGYNEGTVNSCYNNSRVLADTSSGGIAGFNKGTIINSVNLGSVTGLSTADNIGGIAGSNYGLNQNAVIENCYNRGEITNSVSNTCVGGIAGQNYGSSAKIENCYNYGMIIASGLKFGGVAGYSNNSIIKYSYFLQGTAARSVGTAANINVPIGCYSFCLDGTVTEGSSASSSLKSALSSWVAANQSNGKYKSWVGAEFMPMLSLDKKAVAHSVSAMPKALNWNGSGSTAFAGGNGSAIDPYQISTAEQLMHLADLVNSNTDGFRSQSYVLTNNISLNASSSYISWNSSTVGLLNWTPIGTNESPFLGTFNGDKYKINGLYISGSGTHKGLFGKNSGTICNLFILESFVSGNDFIGLIAGENAGEINKTNGNAVISALGGSAGGIAGQNSGVIESTSFKGIIKGSAAATNVGGIVGKNLSGGSLFTLNNSGNLALDGTASGSEVIYSGGGIVGYNLGSVVNCCNSGNITVTGTGTANYRLGGIAGLNDEEIANSINLGTVISSSSYSEVGGIVGINTKTLNNCVNISDGHKATAGFSNAGRIEGGSVKTTSSCFYQYDSYNAGKFLLWNSGTTQYTAELVKQNLNAWAITANNNNLKSPLKYYFWQVFSGETKPTMSRVAIRNVSFDLSGGEFKDSYLVPTVYYVGISNNALPVRTNVYKFEYSLKGWHLQSDLKDDVIKYFSQSYKDDLVFYAEWTTAITEITFDKQDGEGGTDKVIATFGLPMPTDESEESLTAPSMEGYTFSGYYSEANGGGTKYYDKDMQSVQSWDKSGVPTSTLYAYWTINVYNINYKSTTGYTITCQETAEHLTQIDLTVTINECFTQSIPKITIDGGSTLIENSGVDGLIYSFNIPQEKVICDLNVAVVDVTLDKFAVTVPTQTQRIDAENNDALMYNVIANVYAVCNESYSFTLEFYGNYFYFVSAPVVNVISKNGISYAVSGARTIIDGIESDWSWNFTIAENIVKEEFTIIVGKPDLHVHTYDGTYVCGTHTCTVCNREVYVGDHIGGEIATCTTPQICTECGIILVEALGHQFSDQHTCHDRKCIRPGCTDHFDYNEETGLYDIPVPYVEPATTEHDISPLTCTSSEYCLICGDVFEYPLGHEWHREGYIEKWNIIEPTCTEDGSKTRTCCYCGEVQEETIPHLGHDWGEWVTTVSPTCLLEGTRERTCKRAGCGEKETEIIPALGHVWEREGYIEEWTISLTPTCTKAGTKHIVCECLEEKTEAIPALGHTPGAEADCTHAQICTVCEEILVPALGHTAGSHATCTTPQICTVCGDIIVTALGHDWGEWVITKEANCTTKGTRMRSCNRSGCAEKEVEIIPALGHTAGSPATCTHAQICTVCGEIIVPALGHDWVKTEELNPTCEANGYIVYTCTRCGEKKRTDLLALGHIKDIEADCTHDSKCTVCGKVLAPKLGHDFIKTSEVKAACEEDGYIEYICSRCGEKKRDILAALGHTPGNQADCTHDQLCIVCGEILKEKLGHDFLDATYDAPKTCKRCGATEGYPLTQVDNLESEQKADLRNISEQCEAEFLIADIDINKALTIYFAGGSVSIDKTVLSGLTNDRSFTVGINHLNAEFLSEQEKSIVNGLGSVYDVEITVNGSNVLSLEGSVILSLPYTLSGSQVESNVKVWYLNLLNGKMEPLDRIYNSEEGIVTFRVSHLSKYVVGYENPAPKGKPIGLIIGISAGCAVLIAVVVAVVILVRKKGKKPEKVKNAKPNKDKRQAELVFEKTEPINKQTDTIIKKPDNTKKQKQIIDKPTVSEKEVPSTQMSESMAEIIAAAKKRDITAGVVQMRTYGAPPYTKSAPPIEKDKK